MELKSFISLDEAIKKSLKYKPKAGSKNVTAMDAVGQYSLEEVVSPTYYPQFDRSAVDGYAVDSKETISSNKTNPAKFELIGNLYPSSREKLRIGKGKAVKVMTGSRIPIGADSVVMLEDSFEDGTNLSVFVPVRKFQNISRKGEDLKKGFPILKKGKRVDPPHVSALVECGIEKVKVLSLSIGIVSTGDELVSGSIRNSTLPLVQSFFQRKGFRVVGHGAVEDNELSIERVLGTMKEDIIIVTGGTGPGEKDLLPAIIERNGSFVFRGLRIRPGRTTSFGIFRGKIAFLISGLPVAALIASENVILRLIHEWYGLIVEEKEQRNGIMGRSVVNTLGFRSFVRVKVKNERGVTKVYPSRVTGSGVIYSVIDADGMLVIDENSEGIEEGESVTFEVLRW
jgi:molybdopterin molybdotransferase